MKFVLPSDPILSNVAKEVTSNDFRSRELPKIIEQMKAVAFGEQSDNKKPVMVGLAAPQVGIAKRIILVDVAANGKGEVGDLRVYINPEIVFVSEETNEWYEGCYSTSYVCGIVTRPSRVKIQALTRGGEITTEEHEGYIARIFQHEIDHLNGKVFVDHITDDNVLHHVDKNEFTQYRNNQGWRNWPKKVTREEWKKIKGLE